MCPRAKPRVQRNHNRLAKRIDGRVRYLCKALTEERVQRTWTARKERQWGVVAHGPNGILAARSHRLQNHLHVFLGVAETTLLRRKIDDAFGFSDRYQRRIFDQRCVGRICVEEVE